MNGSLFLSQTVMWQGHLQTELAAMEDRGTLQPGSPKPPQPSSIASGGGVDIGDSACIRERYCAFTAKRELWWLNVDRW